MDMDSKLYIAGKKRKSDVNVKNVNNLIQIHRKYEKKSIEKLNWVPVINICFHQSGIRLIF